MGFFYSNASELLENFQILVLGKMSFLKVHEKILNMFAFLGLCPFVVNCGKICYNRFTIASIVCRIVITNSFIFAALFVCVAQDSVTELPVTLNFLTFALGMINLIVIYNLVSITFLLKPSRYVECVELICKLDELILRKLNVEVEFGRSVTLWWIEFVVKCISYFLVFYLSFQNILVMQAFEICTMSYVHLGTLNVFLHSFYLRFLCNSLNFYTKYILQIMKTNSLTNEQEAFRQVKIFIEFVKILESFGKKLGIIFLMILQFHFVYLFLIGYFMFFAAFMIKYNNGSVIVFCLTVPIFIYLIDLTLLLNSSNRPLENVKLMNFKNRILPNYNLFFKVFIIKNYCRRNYFKINSIETYSDVLFLGFLHINIKFEALKMLNLDRKLLFHVRFKSGNENQNLYLTISFIFRFVLQLFRIFLSCCNLAFWKFN